MTDLCALSFVYICCTVTLTVSGEDEFDVYHGGGVVFSARNWPNANTVTLDDACVLAIKTVNIADVLAGMLASTSTGVVTDASWKCSAVNYSGWHLPGFNDSSWRAARVKVANNGFVWPIVAQINLEAQWIWSLYESDDIAYCRKILC